MVSLSAEVPEQIKIGSFNSFIEISSLELIR